MESPQRCGPGGLPTVKTDPYGTPTHAPRPHTQSFLSTFSGQSLELQTDCQRLSDSLWKQLFGIWGILNKGSAWHYPQSLT